MARRKKRTRRKPAPSAATALAVGTAIEGLAQAGGTHPNIPLARDVQDATRRTIAANVPWFQTNLSQGAQDALSGFAGAYAVHKLGAFARKKGLRVRFAGINWP